MHDVCIALRCLSFIQQSTVDNPRTICVNYWSNFSAVKELPREPAFSSPGYLRRPLGAGRRALAALPGIGSGYAEVPALDADDGFVKYGEDEKTKSPDAESDD